MSAPTRDVGEAQAPVRGDVAIIGMAGLFPGAPDLTTYWQNILGKVDTVSDPPPGSWDPATHYDPTSSENDRVYCQKAGYLAPVASFDPLEYGIMPLAVQGGEPDQWLALKMAHAALDDAGYLDRLEVRQRTAVVIGKGTYINRGNLSMVQHGVMVDQTLDIVRSLHPEFGERELAAIRRELKKHLPPFNPDAASGLIPNIIAGRIANRLDLMGPSYTVDAACASSLIAVQVAMRDLLTQECDLALVGGAQITTPIPIFTLFCQLEALSRRQQIRPFDRDADGTILGEGIGMVVLKRIEDAVRDGDRVYAVLKGVGVASDGRGLSVMAPRVEGEVLALRRAYQVAGVDPTTVELIEAHGTGTPVGDAAEIESLNALFGHRRGSVPRTALGSVKSMIGHTMPAAGIAGLIKTALALYHRVLPPTLHVSEPHPDLDLARSVLYLNTEPRPWVHGDPTPRRAGVNSFGFGGINAHAVLEEHVASEEAPLPTCQLDWECELLLLQAPSVEGLLDEVDGLRRFVDRAPSATLKDLAYTLNTRPTTQGMHRLAVVATGLSDLGQKLDRARQKLAEPKTRLIKDAGGIYYFTEPLGPRGKLAVLFPGEGSQYGNMLADLCLHFPQVRAAFDEMDRVLHGHPRGYRPSDVIFPPPLLPDEEGARLEQRLWQIESALEAILAANHGLWSLFSTLGLRPDLVLGHSAGEYSAMRATGVLDFSDEAIFARFARELNDGYQDRLDREGVPTAAMLAVGAERGQVEAVARQAGGDLFVAMDNCPHQAVIVGERAAIERARAVAEEEGLIYEFLAFDRAYHTPLFSQYAEHLRDIFARVPVRSPRIPLYSCTTAAPYPDNPDAIRRLMVEHWVEPVEFRRTIQRLYADEGVRLFLEVGPRGNLSAFVEDILRGQGSFAAIPANLQRRSGISQLNHCLALLSAHGVSLDLGPLYRRRRPKLVDWLSDTPAAEGKRRSEMRLATGFPVMQLSPELARELRAAATGPVVVSEQGRAGLAPGLAHLGLASNAQAPATAADGRRSGPELPLSQPRDGGFVGDPYGDTATPLVPPSPTLSPLPAAHGSQAATVQTFLATMDQFLEVQGRVLQACLGAEPASAASAEWRETAPAPTAHVFPLLEELVAYVPGEHLVARRSFDPAEDRYLRDHTLGRTVSAVDPELLALPVMPLTMSLEVLAEGAAALAPEKVVIALRDVRAQRWITFPDAPQTLEVEARRLPGGASDRTLVQVQLRNLTEDGQSAAPPSSPALEATVVLAETYPDPPTPRLPDLRGSPPTRWHPDTLYAEGMFHGPSWRTVKSVEQTGAPGIVASMEVLPFGNFLRDKPTPRFALDPVILDGAGQVVAFWTLEHLPTGRVIFPYRLHGLEVYGPPRPTGERITCAASVELLGEQQVRSDIDLLDAQGRLWMRLVGWEDKRFDLPERFYPLLLAAQAAEVSEPWAEPAMPLASAGVVACRRVWTDFSSDHVFWKRVWAHCILSRREREEFRRLRVPEPRQLDWVAGRAAAKDAVRAVLRARYGLEVAPADVEIAADEHGRPVADGPWRTLVASPPVLSLSHTDGWAAAMAGLPEDVGPYVGIDLERVVKPRRAATFEELAFRDEERHLLADVPVGELEQWLYRLWCAKEAVAKATGYGLIEGPSSVAVVAADRAMETVLLQLRGHLAQLCPSLAGVDLIAHTRHDPSLGLAVATTLCEVRRGETYGNGRYVSTGAQHHP